MTHEETAWDDALGFDDERDFGGGGFHDLMKRRVGEILLVSSLYDSFIIEEDGQLGDRILADYVDLHLRYAPRVTRVSTGRKALNMMKYRRFDLVLTMMRLPDMDVFSFCRAVKERYLGTPVVVLAYDSLELPQILQTAESADLDQVFVWSGDSRILLAAIKLVEDRWNVDHDTREGMVQVILVVEDSVRRLSTFLPMVYTELMTQTRKVMAEGLNYLDKLVRMRGRPKILLARTYDEAITLFRQYENNLLAVISDVRFPRGDQLDPEAGFALLKWIRAVHPDLPVVLHSSAPENRVRATELGSYFLDKNSETWLADLHHFFTQHLGFGDFTFRHPDGTRIATATNLREMERKILEIPEDSLRYHASRHHISTWLLARGEVSLASRFRSKYLSDFESVQELREYLTGEIHALRVRQHSGVITDFDADNIDPTTPFVRLAGGSLGGKGRGIAFQAALLARLDLDLMFPGVRICVPQTTALGTEAFQRFMVRNDLEEFAVTTDDDLEIARAFLAADLDEALQRDLRAFLEVVHYPLAVRSSSLLEDSLFQPFAGLYSTYMVPNNAADPAVRLRQLSNAIKLVYASTFYRSPKSYIRSTPYRIEEEQMAVIIQRLAAQRHGDRCYPHFAGVAQSYNYYPVGRMKAEEGLAHVALGLGKMVVDGGAVLRFSPARPKRLIQFGSTRDMLRNSQKQFYALDLSAPDVVIEPGSEGPLVQVGLDVAEEDGTLAPVGSVYSPSDGVIRDGIFHEGPRLVTFAHVLKAGMFPLAELLTELLDISRRSMGSEVEIEFAANLSAPESGPHEFSVLQCRPLVAGGEVSEVSLDDLEPGRVICLTDRSLGNGVIRDLTDVVYVSPDRWDNGRTAEIAREIGRINERLMEEQRRAIFIGMGRWGTSDPFLGIPVTWGDIASAKVLVEVGTPQYRIEPSQGSHFFHNITSFRIGYLTVDTDGKQGRIDFAALGAGDLVDERRYARHVRFARPLEVRLDGRGGRGAILLPRNVMDAAMRTL